MIDSVIHDPIVGHSAAIEQVRNRIRKLAPAALPVLIQGPTGSGKELVARALHQESGRAGRFVATNVCAIAESMFEATLFGHVRGAFTGATQDRPGLLDAADGGTLFLDEIGSLSLDVQAKLLRAIELGEFAPVGSTRERVSRFRVVAATNENIMALAAEGRFRADLLHRLGAAVIHMPALHERPEDIPVLAHHFARELTTNGIPAQLTNAGILYLQERPWPGNVRQLRHVINYAAVLAITPYIGPDELAAVGEAAPSVSAPGRAPSGDAESERRHLVALLKQNGWSVGGTAKDLGVHRVTLSRWMRRYGIRRPASRIGRVTPELEAPSRTVGDSALRRPQ